MSTPHGSWNPKKQHGKSTAPPCPHLCAMIPVDVPAPDFTQRILHPKKDVFILKVAKVGPNGDRKCKMELELVSPQSHERPGPWRVDTRGVQCEPCACCACAGRSCAGRSCTGRSCCPPN